VVVEQQLVEGACGGHAGDHSLIKCAQHARDGLRARQRGERSGCVVSDLNPQAAWKLVIASSTHSEHIRG
jgi:hypothetical protein